MAEWLKSNLCLYNKKLESYRESDMTKRLWEEKAPEFVNVDVDYLLGVHQNSFWQVVKDTLWIWSPGVDGSRCWHPLQVWISEDSHQHTMGNEARWRKYKKRLDLKNLILFHIHMYYCIAFILSNPCFVLLYL